MNTYILKMWGVPYRRELGVQVGQIEVRATNEDDAVNQLGHRATVVNGIYCDDWHVAEVTLKYEHKHEDDYQKNGENARFIPADVVKPSQPEPENTSAWASSYVAWIDPWWPAEG